MSALVEHRGHPHPLRTARFTALVVVADDALRGSVVRGLSALGAVEVLQAASVAETRALVRSGNIRDLVVTEVSLPDGSGVSLLTELRGHGMNRGIALSGDGDPFSVRTALAAGTRAFVVREHGALRRPDRPRQGGRRAEGVQSLSSRELEVLTLVAEGRSNRDIGECLELSALTVKSHLARIARKLGTGDRAEMVAVALRAGAIA